MNYDEMSEFEINCEVAMTRYPELQNAAYEAVIGTGNGAANFRLCDALGDDHDAGTYDYCNNPSDAWPIILENGISLDSPLPNLSDLWLARNGQGYRHLDKNPLRCAMIVFLKIKAAENG